MACVVQFTDSYASAAAQVSSLWHLVADLTEHLQMPVMQIAVKQSSQT